MPPLRISLVLPLLLWTLGQAGSSAAQDVPVGDPLEAYVRALQVSGLVAPGSLTSRPFARGLIDWDGLGAAHPWASVTGAPWGGTFANGSWTAGDTRLRAYANTDVPRGWNDGAVWQGRGVTSALASTAHLRWRGLSLTLDPTLVYAQNSGFDLAPVALVGQPVFAYPWRRMDWPQRFGPEGFWTFDLGDSRLALAWKGARVSVSNERLWWGPGIRNAIVMSGNAPGFIHTAVSTNRPVHIGIGTLEGRWIWGGLAQSDWFDPSAEPDRYITGLVLSYAPSFLDGLTVGGTRVFQQYVPDGGLPAGDYLLVLQGLVKTSQISAGQPTGNDERDQILSIFARWVFPESGAEVYAEWARTDHALDVEDFIQEPEHSQGYTLGLQKVTARSSDRLYLLTAELTRLEAAPTFQLRPRATYYEHSVVTQGYTHKGQILGAWVGPGGNSQYLGFTVFDRQGSVGLFVQRQVHDNDALWVWARQNGATFDSHDVSLDVGANALVFRGAFEWGAGLVLTRELNRYFYGPHLWNLNVQISARWRPRTD